MSSLKLVSSTKCFGGFQKVFSHESSTLMCAMNFGIYLPPDSTSTQQLPVIYWLSGLTCTEQNFITKAGAQAYAAKHNFIVVAPDTSPRGCGVPGEDDRYDLGSGAGFYVDATKSPWNKHYNMFSYITKELPEIINNNFPADHDRQSIMGHSMGGHGALICYLKNPGKYRSVSAFSAICNPSQCPWGEQAFKAYLGEDVNDWLQYDATYLVTKYEGPLNDILIDQGDEDDFLKKGQLLPDNFLNACQKAKVPVVKIMRSGYDHSYYYIASFIDEHFDHHAKYLKI